MTAFFPRRSTALRALALTAALFPAAARAQTPQGVITIDPNAPFSIPFTPMKPVYDQGEAPPPPPAPPPLPSAPVSATPPAPPAAFPTPSAPSAGAAPAAPAYPSVSYGAAPTMDVNQPVSIAILLPTSDKRASVRKLADSLAKAATLAAQDIGDQSVMLTAYDDGGDPTKAMEAARKAIDAGARLILGPLFSANAAAVRQVSAPRGIPVIAFSTDVSALGQGVWSIAFLPETELRRVVSYAAGRGLNQMALLTPDTPYGAVARSAVGRAASESGVSILRSQGFPQDFQAIQSVAQDIGSFAKANPQLKAIVLAAGGQTLQTLSSFLAYNDINPTKTRFLGAGAWEEEGIFREATLRGGWFAAPDPVLRKSFEERYKAAYNAAPDPVARLAYDAVATAAALMDDARRTNDPSPFDPDDITNPDGFSGVTGVYRFLPDGRNERALAILEVGRREFKVVDPAPASFGGAAARLSTP